MLLESGRDFRPKTRTPRLVVISLTNLDDDLVVDDGCIEVTSCFLDGHFGPAQTKMVAQVGSDDPGTAFYLNSHIHKKQMPAAAALRCAAAFEESACVSPLRVNPPCIDAVLLAQGHELQDGLTQASLHVR